MTARQLAAKLNRAAAEIAPTVTRALDEATPEIVRAAREPFSGHVPTRVLARPVAKDGLGHPYDVGGRGSRGPHGSVPYGDPAIVNAQSGFFRSRWNGRVTGFRLDIANDTAYARPLLAGGPNSVPRPYDGPIRAFGGPLAAHSVRAAVLALYS